MGLGRWLRQIVVRCREKIGWGKTYGGQYDNLEIYAYFSDGSMWQWEGRPWGSSWERFRAYVEDHAVRVRANMWGDFISWDG